MIEGWKSVVNLNDSRAIRQGDISIWRGLQRRGYEHLKTWRGRILRALDIHVGIQTSNCDIQRSTCSMPVSVLPVFNTGAPCRKFNIRFSAFSTLYHDFQPCTETFKLQRSGLKLRLKVTGQAFKLGQLFDMSLLARFLLSASSILHQ